MKFILHIGATKTGSSALQGFLDVNREVLAEAGVLYPARGLAAGAHHLLAACLHPNASGLHREVLPRCADARARIFAREVAQIQAEAEARSARVVILSSEYLWGVFTAPLYAGWRQALEGCDVMLYAVLRRADDWVQSSYLQAVKSGETAAFDRWYAGFRRKPFKGTDFAEVIDRWTEGLAPLVRPASVVLRPYEALAGDALYRDVLELAGLESDLILRPAPAASSNPSPGPAALAALLKVNREMAPMAQSAAARQWILGCLPKRRIGEKLDLIPAELRHEIIASQDETLPRLRRYGFPGSS